MLVFAALLASAPPPPREPLPRLSQEYAAWRASQVSDVRYALSVSLDAQRETYSGKVEIQFALTEPNVLLVDFEDGKVTSVTSNGRRIRAKYDRHAVHLPAEALVSGVNRISIDFTHKYSTNGEALTRFKDSEDGRVYLFSDLEPFYANRIFPCFDQPDLKAIFRLTVEAPASWVVVTSVRESSIEKLSGGRARFVFPDSPRFSTYVFSLHAGEYAVLEDLSGSVPLRIFVRQTLASRVVPEEWFTLTNQGLDFFSKYFEIPYPFPKYDHVIAPAMNYEAMENVGAVTIQEAFLYPGEPTREELEGRARLVLHEMAHMWFGNLVTTRWWDDLWLNESFASLMSSLAVAALVPENRTLLAFNSGMKQSAYLEDQLPTTHPVAGAIPTTEEAFSSFDGITYGKGASALRQLSFALGPEVFRRGVVQLLKSRANGSATRADFVRALEKEARTDLSGWSRSWLETAGLDTVEVELECSAGKVKALALRSATSDRVHRTRVATYATRCPREPCHGGGAVVLTSSVTVTYSGPRTPVPELSGQPCPDFVFPNHGDEDYVKVALDPKQLEFAKSRVWTLSDPLLRMMIWQVLWESVRSGALSPDEYARTIVSSIGALELPEIAGFVFGTLARGGTTGSLLRYAGRAPGGIEALLLKRLQTLDPTADEWKVTFDGFVGLAAGPEALSFLEAQLATGSLDSDRRWAAIRALSAAGAPSASRLLARERKRDRSDAGRLHATEVESTAPSVDSKRRLLNKLTKRSVRLEEKIAIMQALLPVTQEAAREALAPELLGLVSRSSGDEELDSRIAASLAPVTCTDASVRRLDELLVRNPTLPVAMKRELLIAKDEDARCARIRAAAR
ncbi:MAG: aminopeptidase N [Deltaproteobacteria bacterium]|nr:aminopeptidase N [Deltaproteobacteria bacterium]